MGDATILGIYVHNFIDLKKMNGAKKVRLWSRVQIPERSTVSVGKVAISTSPVSADTKRTRILESGKP
jgi:hypothetical protein